MLQLRVARDITQRELAARLGVHPVQVSRWETGHASPPWAIAVEIAHAIGHYISLHDLYGAELAADLSIPAALADLACTRAAEEVARAAHVTARSVSRFRAYARAHGPVMHTPTVERYADALHCTIVVRPKEGP